MVCSICGPVRDKDLKTYNLASSDEVVSSPISPKGFPKVAAIVAGVAALGVLAAVLSGLLAENSDIAECKRLVRDSLKSPSSAIFTEVSVFYGTHPLSGDKTVKVEGVVDAQNSFGAVLANDFYCSKINTESLILEYVASR